MQIKYNILAQERHKLLMEDNVRHYLIKMEFVNYFSNNLQVEFYKYFIKFGNRLIKVEKFKKFKKEVIIKINKLNKLYQNEEPLQINFVKDKDNYRIGFQLLVFPELSITLLNARDKKLKFKRKE